MQQRASSRDSLFSVTSDAPCSEIFHLGEQCKIDENRVGIVAFVGNTKFAPGLWIGLVLDRPDGKNDGSVDGNRYFQCKEKHGIFCRPSKLTKLSTSSCMSPILSNGPASPTPSIARSIASTTAATNKMRSIYAHECGFDIGERVSIGAGKVGVLKFLDRINNELYAGVQLDRPLGCCDGVFNNVRYFKCNPLYGIFVKASMVKKCAKTMKPAAIEVRHTKASTLRTWKGSQESLNSAGAASLCSMRNPVNVTPKLVGKSAASFGGNVKDSEIVASLKTCLQEKEAHLERMSKELEQRRAEAENVSLQNGDLTVRVMELNEIVVNSRKEREDALRKTEDLEEQCEELRFQLDEAHVQKNLLEAEISKLHSACSNVERNDGRDFNTQSDVINQTHSESQTKMVSTSDSRMQTEDFAELEKKELASTLIQTEQDDGRNFATQTDAINQTHSESQTKTVSTSDSRMQTEQNTGKDFATQTNVVEQTNSESRTNTNSESKMRTDQPAKMSTVGLQTQWKLNEHETPRKNMKSLSAQTSPFTHLYQHSETQTEKDNNNVLQLDVSKLAVTLQSRILSNGPADFETILKEKEEKIEQLESTVSYLLAERNPVSADSSEKRTKNRRIRLYCEHCEIFDKHDTFDCSLEVEERAEKLAHTTTSPRWTVASKNSKTTHAARSFCDHCETFTHDTNDCPHKSNGMEY